MEQGLVIGILVAVIVLLILLLSLLVLAATILAYNNRQQDLRDERFRKHQQEKVRKMVPRDVPSPTPISRVAGPPPMDFVVPADADEAATEVISSRQAAAMFGMDEDTGTTEVRHRGSDEAQLQLEDTEETTEVNGPIDPGRIVAEKK